MTKLMLATHLLAALYGALLALKAAGWLAWSWWIVLAPVLAAVPAAALLLLLWWCFCIWGRGRGGGAGGWM